MKAWAEKFYKSTAWQKCRAAYVKEKFGICERCGKPGKIVHHKIYLTPDNINCPEITMNFNNLELVCKACHNQEHIAICDRYTREGLDFDKDGKLIRKPGKTENLN